MNLLPLSHSRAFVLTWCVRPSASTVVWTEHIRVQVSALALGCDSGSSPSPSEALVLLGQRHEGSWFGKHRAGMRAS